MKFDKTEVFNFENALRGARNPLESWNKSDSNYCCLDDSLDCNICSLHNHGCNMLMSTTGAYIIGKNDMKLAQKLILAGSDHRKFMRQIFVSVDITAPLYWYKEFDTYKINTVANSTSTMHKLATTPITKECFAFDNVIENYGGEGELKGEPIITLICNLLENYRQEYLITKNPQKWKALIQLIPESWLQTRTVTMNYENLLNMIKSRKNHKLTEWSVDFINWCHTLPYAEELLFIGGDN